MEFSGTLRGAPARKYSGYGYRRPVQLPVDIWSLDPERLHPAHEYPRSVNPPSAPTLPTVDLVDYVVKIGAQKHDGMSPVQVWVKPNEYTFARKPLLVCEFHVSNAFTLRHEYCDEALVRAFGTPYRHASDKEYKR